MVLTLGFTLMTARAIEELDVHLEQVFLHVLDVGGTLLDELGSVTQERAQSDQVSLWAQGTC